MSEEVAAEAMEVLSRFLVADTSLEDTLTRVAELTVGAIPAAAFVGIALLDDAERVTTAIFTDEQAPQIDQAQYDERRGPCLDAWREQRIVRIDDVAVEGPAAYPAFSQACLDHGIHSTLSLPLVASDQGVGALNLYAEDATAFSPADQEVGCQLATAASVVLANAAAYWGAYDLSQQMDEAMQSRAVIEQAKGMLMARSSGLSADDAFELLRRASQREDVRVRDIAQRIVERRPLASPPEG
jgi:GAF domain-containing protein